MSKNKLINWWMKHKTAIGFIGVALMLVAVIAVIVVTNQAEPIPEGYFTSDDVKLVLALDKTEAAYEENVEYAPEMTYIVYDYSGEKITGARIYFEYADEAAAKEANAHITLSNKNWAASRRLNGKYIVFTVKREQYENLSTEKVRENIKSLSGM